MDSLRWWAIIARADDISRCTGYAMDVYAHESPQLGRLEKKIGEFSSSELALEAVRWEMQRLCDEANKKKDPQN